MKERQVSHARQVAPLTETERAHVEELAASIRELARHADRTLSSLGLALGDVLKVRSDVQYRRTHGELFTAPLTQEGMARRLYAMNSHAGVTDELARLATDVAEKAVILGHALEELVAMGRGESPASPLSRPWPEALSATDLHARLWTMQTTLIAGRILARRPRTPRSARRRSAKPSER